MRDYILMSVSLFNDYLYSLDIAVDTHLRVVVTIAWIAQAKVTLGIADAMTAPLRGERRAEWLHVHLPPVISNDNKKNRSDMIY